MSDNFRKKFNPWRAEVSRKYPNAVVFEARRSQERQKYLYAQGREKPYEKNRIVTWTMDSKHLSGDAVDIVFMNDWKLERIWPYKDLIDMAKNYGIENLAPRELCHFQDNGLPFENNVAIINAPLVQEGIRNGDRAYSPATRYEVALMIQRAIAYITKKNT